METRGDEFFTGADMLCRLFSPVGVRGTLSGVCHAAARREGRKAEGVIMKQTISKILLLAVILIFGFATVPAQKGSPTGPPPGPPPSISVRAADAGFSV